MPHLFPVIVPDFQLNFENLQVFVTKMEIDTLVGLGSEEFNAMVPYSLISSDLQASGFPGSKDIVGMVYGTFRVEGENPNMAFEIEAHIRARPKSKSQPADTVNKAMQYIYDWVDAWIIGNGVVDNNNLLVKLPPYSHSRGHFEKNFPDEDWGR